MPFLVARMGSDSNVGAALRADPSVASVEPLESHRDEQMYRVEWDLRSDALLRAVREENGTVLDATASDGRWRFRLLFPDRNAVSRCYERCQEAGARFEVHSNSINDLATASSRRPGGLSGEQYTTLKRSLECGFYEVPRETTLEELSEEFDVSHQALSERLRRAHKTVVTDAV